MKGLRARGGFDVDIACKEGLLTEAVIRSVQGESCTVRYRDKKIELQLQSGQSQTLDTSLVW